MRTKRYRAIAVLAFLVTATALAFPDAQSPLLAAEDNSLKPDPEQKYIAIL